MEESDRHGHEPGLTYKQARRYVLSDRFIIRSHWETIHEPWHAKLRQFLVLVDAHESPKSTQPPPLLNRDFFSLPHEAQRKRVSIEASIGETHRILRRIHGEALRRIGHLSQWLQRCMGRIVMDAGESEEILSVIVAIRDDLRFIEASADARIYELLIREDRPTQHLLHDIGATVEAECKRVRAWIRNTEEYVQLAVHGKPRIFSQLTGRPPPP